MPLLAWGQWKPDVSDFLSDASQNISNVIPRGDGYGPFNDFAALSQALPAVCRGGFYALKSDGSVAIFAATADRIFLANNTDFSWKAVSKYATVTSISNASPGVVTKTAHGFAVNDPVVFSTDGALPTGLTAGTNYFVKTVLTADTFTVSATPGGAAIDTSSAGSGTHSVTWFYSTLSADAQWQFVQFGNYVIAVQANVAPQVFDLSSSTAFANLSGSPPQAAYASIVGRFVVLSGLLSAPYKIQWSALDDVTGWTPGTNSSDEQEFPDGGIVRGVAGGEFGVVFQDQAIRRMSYIPGSTIIFQIERIAEQKGLFGPYSIVRAGDTVFFHSAKGFHKIEPGSPPVQIGRERVDRTFFDALDKNALKLFIGAADPRSTKVFWAYKTASSSVTTRYDAIIGYDSALDRFFPVLMTGEYLMGLSQPGLTLEGLDSLSSSLDALAASLDSFSVSTTPSMSQFNTDHKLGFFSGLTLEAELETSEQGTDKDTIFIRGVKPVTDAVTVYGSLRHRMTLQDLPTEGAERLINSRTGKIDLRRDARYQRIKNRIPAGTNWTYHAGVVPDVEGEGED